MTFDDIEFELQEILLQGDIISSHSVPNEDRLIFLVVRYDAAIEELKALKIEPVDIPYSRHQHKNIKNAHRPDVTV